MLTAAGLIDDRVRGLDLGADDYLVKPFAFRELIARVAALGRRPVDTVPTVMEVGDLTIDLARRRVVRGAVVIALNPKELGVLIELARSPGVWLSAEHLLEKVWDANADPFSQAVRVTMARLRSKLGDASLIETSRGVGYRLVQP